MNHRDIAVLMDGIAPVLRGYVEKAFEPIGARITVLERSIAELSARDPDPVLILRLVEETVAKLPPAEPGKDGKDADPELVTELVNKAVAALEPAKDGEPGPAGQNGKDADPMEVANLLVDLMPVPAPGKDGEPGKSVTVEDLAPLIEEMVAKAVAEIPAAKDGVDGKEGPPGRDGRDGLPGVQGEKGIDGRNGIDGADGKDGFSLTDFKMKSDDDGRTIDLSFEREGRDPIVHQIKLATVLDRGVWRDQAYEKGDGVTWGGSFFIAQRQTLPNEKPGEVPEAFRLAVKRGRDGKEGKPGPVGERGLKGEQGTAGRNYV